MILSDRSAAEPGGRVQKPPHLAQLHQQVHRLLPALARPPSALLLVVPLCPVGPVLVPVLVPLLVTALGRATSVLPAVSLLVIGLPPASGLAGPGYLLQGFRVRIGQDICLFTLHTPPMDPSLRTGVDLVSLHQPALLPTHHAFQLRKEARLLEQKAAVPEGLHLAERAVDARLHLRGGRGKGRDVIPS